MRKISVFIVVVLILTAIGILFLRNPEKQAWKQAEQKNSIESYEHFLQKYSDGDFTSIAQSNLLSLKEEDCWEHLISEPSVESYSTFILDYPDSEYIGEVKKRYKASLVHTACEQYVKTQDADQNRSIETLEKIATMAQGESPPSDPNDYRIAIDILALLQKLPDAEIIRISFSDIQPESGAESLRLGEYAMSKSVSMTGHVSESGSYLSFTGMIVPPDGRLSGAIALGEGSISFFDPSTRFRNFSGNIAITSNDMNVDSYTAFTELPDEWVFYKMGGFNIQSNQNDSGILLPNGRGTVIRFKGMVRNYFDGFTIYGEEEYPLVFVLLDDAGLTYVCGKGSVTDHDGRKWLFPKDDT